MPGNNDKPVLVFGATGYVGGRLLPRLLAHGWRVRAVGRNIGKLANRSWAGHPQVELAQADMADLEALKKATEGCQAAYYLVHSMISAGRKYKDLDRLAAHNMIAAADASSLKQLIYLGGLGEESEGLSDHLKSRTEVGRILSSGKTPATTLRAAMILGSGSASFEMLRYLTERLPFMITPRWVYSKVQPISISNVLDYLIGCLGRPETLGRRFDIGGPDVLSYAELFQIYAQEAGLKPRIIVPTPFFTPKLSSYWIHLVTPVPASIARPLAEGLRNNVIVKDPAIREIIPSDLTTCRNAIRSALEKYREDALETCWLDSSLPPPEWPLCEDPDYTGGSVLKSYHRVVIEAEPDIAWQPIVSIGGRNGYYHFQSLWRLRGVIDRIAGGVGLSRGRRDPHNLRQGDAFDFWRVEVVEDFKRLKLMAEIRSPGRAYLEFVLNPISGGRTEIIQKSTYHPNGAAGFIYWYSMLPAHNWMFKGMLKGLALKTKSKIIAGPEQIAPV